VSTDLALMLGEISDELGARTSPMPQKLLGREKPLRAFIGHVEPTFDWTLLDTVGRKPLTGDIIDSVWPNIGRSEPIGYAFRDAHSAAGSYYSRHDDAVTEYARRVPGAEGRALAYLLAARDRRSLVVLGDPTVALPNL
jgi:hypothetical protein